MRIKKPKFWDNKQKTLISILLLPISALYLLFFWINRIFVNSKTYKKPTIPVICVGNIYLGGTGKTPLVREIYKIIKSLGKNPAIVKKYYDYLSDEIKMLEKTGQIYTSRKRNTAIFLSASNSHDVAILDDGFQDFSIIPSLSILCFNSKQMIGNGQVIPAGPLRESLNAIQRADCIIINGDKNLEFEKKILKFKRKKQLHIFYSKYKIKNIEKFKDKTISAFAGIGNPSNFFDLLIESNLNLNKTHTFPDHHNYSKKDFEILGREKSNVLVTTEKDYYRLSENQRKICQFIEVDLEIENQEIFKNIIKSYL